MLSAWAAIGKACPGLRCQGVCLTPAPCIEFDSPQVEQPAPEEKQPPADGPFTAHCRSCGARYQFASMPQYMEFVANSPCCPRPDWQVE